MKSKKKKNVVTSFGFGAHHLIYIESISIRRQAKFNECVILCLEHVISFILAGQKRQKEKKPFKNLFFDLIITTNIHLNSWQDRTQRKTV